MPVTRSAFARQSSAGWLLTSLWGILGCHGVFFGVVADREGDGAADVFFECGEGGCEHGEGVVLGVAGAVAAGVWAAVNFGEGLGDEEEVEAFRVRQFGAAGGKRAGEADDFDQGRGDVGGDHFVAGDFVDGGDGVGEDPGAANMREAGGVVGPEIDEGDGGDA